MRKTRYLHIKAITTVDFKKYHGKNWQEVIRKTIRECSKIYEKEFGIKLVLEEIKIRNFQPKACIPYYLFDYIGGLQNKTDIKNFDAIVAFANTPFFCGGEGPLESETSKTLGILHRSTRFILLSNPEKTRMLLDETYKDIDSSFLKLMLIHELAHLFGAENVENKKSFMDGDLTPKACFFNKANKQIILKNKWKKFRESKAHNKKCAFCFPLL